MLVTPNDFLRLMELVFSHPGYGASVSIPTFDNLVEHIEPHLVITEPGGAADWYMAVELARGDLTGAGGSRRDSPAFEVLAKLAEKYWMLTGPEPQRRLDFIKNPALRRIAEEDWTRLVAAAQREDGKTTAIAAGSVVEAVALDVLEGQPDPGALRERLNGLPPDQRMNLLAKGPPSKWPFAFLLLALGPRGLAILSESTHAIGHKLREWRNLVHPNEARSEPPLSPADGRMAAGFAEKVLEEVQARDSGSKPAAT